MGKWFSQVCNWKSPFTSVLVHILFLILICYLELILPTLFLYMFLIGLWNYRFRPRNPPHMDTKLSWAETVHPDELDEEFDTFVAGRIQTVVADIAMQGEVSFSTELERHQSHQPLRSVQFVFNCGSVCNTTKSSCVLSKASKVSQQTSFCTHQLLQEASS